MGYERNYRGERGGRDYRSYSDDGYRGGYGDPRDRGFFERAGDEVRSWFGDEEAERRRRYDERYDERIDRDRYSSEERGGYRPPSARTDWYRSNRDEGSAYYGRADHGRAGSVSAGRDRTASYAEDYIRGYGREDGRRDHGVRDEHGYADWRDRQMSAFDRDYDEYRRENQSRFESEFAAWRQKRQTQRDSLGSVKEHQEVVGSDGAHVGTVDHVRSDHILLTKTDKDAGGHHHSIPSSWVASVGDTVQLSRTAEEAKRAWRDTEERGGLFGDGREADRATGRGQLDRSFSGTY
jgi:hypothetical protein